MARAAGVDPVDRRIVAALQRDGRRPFTAIARDLGISEAAVRQRVARLQTAGVMQVVAVADPMTLGFKTMAMVAISVDGRARKQAAEAVRRLP
ncbi:MAG: Lrp/AsnC family transcriptional regulator, partial [Acidimicrobiales bacterium]